jgi:cytochrome c oxidase assembly protein subunit 15
VEAESRRAVAVWLLVCAAFTFATVIVGGVTRLTHSGLSITEWQPLVGAIPPLSQVDWEILFAKYRESPQFRQVFPDMNVEGFKGIFWWEYLHRLFGRVIGLVFLLPFLWFLLRRKLDAPLAWKLGAIFVLGALQGALGWWMVQSGLVDNPRVSHFRLTAHLGLALVIFCAELWLALTLLKPSPGRPRTFSLVVLGVIFLMALSGGMVAGLRAGHAYNTFPLMNGHVVHRSIFWLLLLLIPLLWFRLRTIAAHHLLAMFILQAALGISTLLLAVPVSVAGLHQAGAVLLLAAAIWTAASDTRS